MCWISKSFRKLEYESGSVFSETVIDAYIDMMLEFYSQAQTIVWQDVIELQFIERRKHRSSAYPCYTAQTTVNELP